MTKRQAIIRISRETLREMLHLPEGTQIIDVSAQVFFYTGEVAIKVEHEGLREVPEGSPLSEVRPNYRRRFVDEVVEFVSWE